MLLVVIYYWLLNLFIGYQSDFRMFVYVDICCNNGYVQFVIYIWVKRSIDNYSCVVGSKCMDGVIYCFEFIQMQVEVCCDVNQYVVCVRQVDIFQQWRRDSYFSSFFCMVFIVCYVRIYYCVVYFRYYGVYVCKVYVY